MDVPGSWLWRCAWQLPTTVCLAAAYGQGAEPDTRQVDEALQDKNAAPKEGGGRQVHLIELQLGQLYGAQAHMGFDAAGHALRCALHDEGRGTLALQLCDYQYQLCILAKWHHGLGAD